MKELASPGVEKDEMHKSTRAKKAAVIWQGEAVAFPTTEMPFGRPISHHTTGFDALSHTQIRPDVNF